MREPLSGPVAGSEVMPPGPPFHRAMWRQRETRTDLDAAISASVAVMLRALVPSGSAVVVASFLPYTQLRRGNMLVDTFTLRLPPRAVSQAATWAGVSPSSLSSLSGPIFCKLPRSAALSRP